MPRIKLSSLLITMTAACATLSQSPTTTRFVAYRSDLHQEKQRYWLPDGAAMAAERIPNPTFFLPGVGTGMWFWWRSLERRRSGARQ